MNQIPSKPLSVNLSDIDINPGLIDIPLDSLYNSAYNYQSLLDCLNDTNNSCFDYAGFNYSNTGFDMGYRDILQDHRFAAAAIVFYVAVIIVGTLGNLLVVLTLCSRKHNCSATDVFIVSLAVADILVSEIYNV